MSVADDDAARFERVDWDRVVPSRQIVTRERVALFVGLALVGGLYLYDTLVAHVYIVFDWRVDAIDYAFLVALVILVAYGVIPLCRRPDLLGRTWIRLRRDRLALAGLGVLAGVAIAGVFGPAIGLIPRLQLEYAYNPPLGFTSEVHRQCAGATTGDAFNEVCHGSLAYPFGTSRRGIPMERLILAGARPALYVIVIGAMLVVPIATAVGVIAGVRGGLVDRLLMAYVDLQLSIPAILIYFFAYMWWGPSLMILLLAFGLLSWGGVARLVRSEVIHRRGDGHVVIARSLGASEYYVATRHILPNITNTLIPAVFHLLAIFVLYEAGVAFLGFYEAELDSWGRTISESTNAVIEGQQHTHTDNPAYSIWWVSTLPAIALALTMASCKVLGDGLRDALDPRRER